MSLLKFTSVLMLAAVASAGVVAPLAYTVPSAFHTQSVVRAAPLAGYADPFYFRNAAYVAQAPAAVVAAAPYVAQAQYVNVAPVIAARAAPVVAARAAPVITARADHVVAAAPVVAARQLEEVDLNPQYHFGYAVNDALTGDNKAQFESRNGDFVKGQYSLIEADGTRRIVDYTADPVNGFNAVVQKDAPVAAAPVVAAEKIIVA